MMVIKNTDGDRKETSHQSYVLRIWKTGKGSIKGYLLDPITRIISPVVNIPTEELGDVLLPAANSKGVWINSMGIWLAIWKPDDGDENLE